MRVNIDEIKEAGLRKAWDVPRQTVDEMVAGDRAGFRASGALHVDATLARAERRVLLALRAKAGARRGIDAAEVEARIAERAEARKAKDFARGDAIRDALLARGVALLDGPQGTTWDVE